ncbi:MAG: alpha-L-fucosidase [Planctomycetota bacterium]
MKNLRVLTPAMLGIAFAFGGRLLAQDHSVDQVAPYKSTWESLEKHDPAPEWFRDAKFGVYFHWGIYSVPAFGSEWYPRYMNETDNWVQRHHDKKFGGPIEHPYDKFVPGFTAEEFDADQWCDLFVQSGARFVGPVAEHHDGYAMWDSQLTPWTSVKTGPKRDITGEMEKAARKRGLKFVTTFHHARNNLWEIEPGKWTGHFEGAKKNFEEVLSDPDRAIMYGYISRDEFLEMWNGKLEEVIDNYSPDLIWFDSWLHEIPEANQQAFLAHYLNHAAKNDQDVVVTYKQEDLPQSIGVLDIEKGGLDKVTKFAWLTDDTISMGSWCYTENLKIKPTNVVLHSLVDIVSKNGQLILNVSPTAAGVIPENQQQVLRDLGAWMKVNGEAIYETRPFVIHGHGPTVPGKGNWGGKQTDIAYTAADVRYTRSKDWKTVYAFCLGAPEAGSSTVLEGFDQKLIDRKWSIDRVSRLDSGDEVSHELSPAGLTITHPAAKPNSMTVVYKIELN